MKAGSCAPAWTGFSQGPSRCSPGICGKGTGKRAHCAAPPARFVSSNEQHTVVGSSVVPPAGALGSFDKCFGCAVHVVPAAAMNMQVDQLGHSTRPSARITSPGLSGKAGDRASMRPFSTVRYNPVRMPSGSRTTAPTNVVLIRSSSVSMLTRTVADLVLFSLPHIDHCYIISRSMSTSRPSFAAKPRNLNNIVIPW